MSRFPFPDEKYKPEAPRLERDKSSMAITVLDGAPHRGGTTVAGWTLTAGVSRRDRSALGGEERTTKSKRRSRRSSVICMGAVAWSRARARAGGNPLVLPGAHTDSDRPLPTDLSRQTAGLLSVRLHYGAKLSLASYVKRQLNLSPPLSVRVRRSAPRPVVTDNSFGLASSRRGLYVSRKAPRTLFEG